MLTDQNVVFPQNEGSVQSAMIMLHGYGADGADLLSMAPFFQKQNPHTAFYAPDAPYRQEHGYKWFDVDELAADTVFERFGYIDALMKKAKAVVPLVEDFIDKIKAKHDIKDDKIVLMGFSQGGLLALMAGLTRSVSLNSLISCSGVPLAINENMTLQEVKSTPSVLLTHGDDDDRVPLIGMQITQNTLKNLGCSVETHTVPGMGHDIDMTSMQAISAFMQQHLP